MEVKAWTRGGTYGSLSEPEVWADERSEGDDLRACLQVEEEERQFFVQFRGEGVVVANLGRACREPKERVSPSDLEVEGSVFRKPEDRTREGRLTTTSACVNTLATSGLSQKSPSHTSASGAPLSPQSAHLRLASFSCALASLAGPDSCSHPYDAHPTWRASWRTQLPTPEPRSTKVDVGERCVCAAMRETNFGVSSP